MKLIDLPNRPREIGRLFDGDGTDAFLYSAADGSVRHRLVKYDGHADLVWTPEAE